MIIKKSDLIIKKHEKNNFFSAKELKESEPIKILKKTR